MKKPKFGEMRSDIQGGNKGANDPWSSSTMYGILSIQDSLIWALCKTDLFSLDSYELALLPSHTFPTSRYEDKGHVQILTSTGWPVFSKMFCRQRTQPSTFHLSRQVVLGWPGFWDWRGNQWHTDLSLTLSEPDSHQVVYSDKEDTDPLSSALLSRRSESTRWVTSHPCTQDV